MTSRTHARSPYMEFAKLRSPERYNLASSGMASFPLAELGVELDQLDINGPDVYGYEPLKQAIASRYRVPVECVVTSAGTSMANYLAMAACVEPGEEALIEQPTYPLLLDTARYLGIEIKRLSRPAERNFSVDLDDLENNLTSRTKLIVLCNMHNPSSALIEQSTMRSIGEMAKRVGARVLVDEVYLEMLWQREPHSCVHLDPEVFISTNSLTKGYGLSGLRSGWVLAEPELATRMWHINDLHASTPVYAAEVMSVIAFEKLEQIAAMQKARLDVNRGLLKEFLETQTVLDYFLPEHGTVIAPRVKNGDGDSFAAALRKREISVVPGSFFEMPDRVRIGVGAPTEEVREALQMLSAALRD